MPTPTCLIPALDSEPVRGAADNDFERRFGRLWLDAALAASELPVGQFAQRVLGRDRRTVQRWRAGTSPIPRSVGRRLVEYLRDRRDPAA